MAKARQEPEQAPLAIRQNSMMVCIGGPRHGHVYFETYGSASWAEQTRVSSTDPEPGSTITCYARTEEYRKHPRWPALKCRVWLYVDPERGK